GDAILVHVAKLLRGRLRASDIVARYGGDEFLLVLPDTALEDSEGVANMLRGRLAADSALCDDIEVAITGSFGVTVLRPGENLSVTDLVRMADEAMYSAKHLGGNHVVVWNQVQGDGESALLASDEVRLLERRVRAINEQNRDVYLERMAELIRDLEARHPYFVGHSGRVAEYASAVGRQMGLRPDKMGALNRAALLHDLGRYVIPEEVLSRSGPLSRSDWALVRQHPAVSERIVGQLRFLQREASVIRHHHERVDGRGYPDGLAGEAIPLESRILAVADALDAMTSPRSHRGPYPLEEALEQLRFGAGSQFDARVAEAAISAAQEAGTWPLVAEPAPVASGANGLCDARERPRRTPPPRRR
ncbi:MAG TPA: diguanylate cyclase, partial [Phycisphaerae bacterium]|nr:diguanylate cyclase [Phycisphaerae bacterium]